MEMTIYVLGNIDFTYRILVGLNMLYQGQTMHLMAASLLILFTLWTFIKWMLNPQNAPYPFREFTFGVIFYMIFGGIQYISPRVDVRIETDTYSGMTYQTRTVSDIPMLAVAPAWLMTNMFRGLRDTIAPLLYIPGEMSGAGYPGVGSGIDPLTVLLDINDMSNATQPGPKFPYVEKSVKDYVRECFMPFYELSGNPSDPDHTNLFNTPVENIWDTADIPANFLTTKVYTDTNPSGLVTNCPDAHDEIAIMLTDDVMPVLQDYLTGLNISATDITNSLGLILNSLDNATMPNPYQFMAGKMFSTYMASVFYESPSTMWSNKMMFEAAQKRVFERAAESNMFVMVMIPMVTAIEAFSFFIAPILMLLTVMGGAGVAYMTKYLMLTLFINLWGFIKIFTDFFMLLTVHLSFTGDLNIDSTVHPFTFVNQYATYMELENFLSIASSLTTAIPMLALFLLYGGVHSLMGVMRTMEAGNVAANNLAPTVGAPLNNGTASFGDTALTNIASHGGWVQTQQLGNTAGFAQESHAESYKAVRSDMLARNNERMTMATHSLANNFSELFSKTSSGGTSETSGQRESDSFAVGRQQVNSLTDQSGIQISSDRNDSSQVVGRLAAAIALQLKAGGNGGNVDNLDNAEVKQAMKAVGKTFGFGGDLNVQGIAQLTQGDTESFRENINKALSFMESESSGQTFSSGFDWAKVDNTSLTASDSDTVAQIKSNIETISDAQRDQRVIQNSMTSDSTLSSQKDIKWNVSNAGLVAAVGGAGDFEQFNHAFGGLDDTTQQKMLSTYGGTDASSLYTNLWKEFGHTENATKLMYNVGQDFIANQDFTTAAKIYERAGDFAGDYTYAFDTQADNLRSLAQTKQEIDSNTLRTLDGETQTTQVEPNSPNNLQMQHGPTQEAEKVKLEAQAMTTQPLENKARAKADEYNLEPDKKVQGQTTGLDVPNGEKVEELRKTGEALKTHDSQLENVDALRAVTGIVGSAMQGLQGAIDFLKFGESAWFDDAKTWSNTISTLADASGLRTEGLVESLQDMAVSGRVDYAELRAGLANGDQDAYEKLSSLNDARMFITSTEIGQNAYQGLNDEDKSRVSDSLGQINELVGSLDQTDSPVSSSQMNELSRARLSGEISDKTADTLLAMSTSSATGELDKFLSVYMPSDSSQALMYSAVNGSIAENETLRSMLDNSLATVPINESGLMDSFINTVPALAYVMNSGDYKTLDQALSYLRQEDSPILEEYQSAYNQDIYENNVTGLFRGSALELDEHRVQGVNKELPQLEELRGQAMHYYHMVTSDSYAMQDGIEQFNTSYIENAGSWTKLGSAHDYGLAYLSTVITADQMTAGMENTPEVEKFREAWTNLGEQSDGLISISRDEIEAREFRPVDGKMIEPKR